MENKKIGIKKSLMNSIGEFDNEIQKIVIKEISGINLDYHPFIKKKFRDSMDMTHRMWTDLHDNKTVSSLFLKKCRRVISSVIKNLLDVEGKSINKKTKIPSKITTGISKSIKILDSARLLIK